MWNKLFSKNKSIEIPSPISSSASVTTHKKIKKKNKLSNVLSNLSLRKSDKNNHEIIAFIETTTREINFNRHSKRISQDFSFLNNKDRNDLNIEKILSSPTIFPGKKVKFNSWKYFFFEITKIRMSSSY